MFIRPSTIRHFTIFVFATILFYVFILRLLLPNTRAPEKVSIAKLTQPSTASREELPESNSVDASVQEELDLFQASPIRVLPSELHRLEFKRDYVTKVLSYDEKLFRQLSTPILWLDEQGDVRWNLAAEYSMLNYLTRKQFPNVDRIRTKSMDKNEIMDLCRPHSLFLLHQHWSGFFSRVLCFIAQFGQTLQTSRIGVLRGLPFSGARGDVDDFLGEGINRYFLPASICSAFQHHQKMKDLKELIQSSTKTVHISNTKELFKNRNNQIDQMFLSTEYWKLDYHHVPIRKWLFDRKKPSVTYGSPMEVLTDHTDEHIYAPNNENNVPIGDWINTNKPDAFSSDLLPNNGNYTLTWRDHVFGSFLRYMFVLFFGSRNSPHVEYGARVLTQYWLSHLMNKYSLTSPANVFDKLAGLYIRRGDKSSEDSFWHKHHHWRNISYYVKGIVDEEERQRKKFSYIFVVTDDKSVMQMIRDYANPKSTGDDELYARKHLRERDILFNILAPQDCFDPFHRIGFDQFLVSMRFLIEYSAFTIGHTDSNVFRFFREVVYVQRQHRPGVQTYTYVQNAPDSFNATTKIPKPTR